MNDQLKKTIIDLIVKKIMEEAVKKASYLAWGPLNFIASAILTKALQKAIEFGILELGVALMKREVNKQVSEVREIVQKYTEDKTDVERKELDEELKKAYDDLFKF
jgi:hypothetical protein